MAYELKNHMEVIVRHQLKDLLAESEMCTCDLCRMDVMALTLNQLPPKYVVTRRGELMTEIDATLVQHQADVMSAGLKAMQIVKNNPRCENSTK